MLSRALARYVDLQRFLGFKFHLQHRLLASFVAFAEGHGDTRVSSARAIAWAGLAPSPEQRRNRLLIVRRFALMMHAEDGRHEIPPADALGRAVVKRRPPYIYAPEEIAALMRAATALEPLDSMRPLTYTTLLGLLAATGMRISEALALHLDDVTADGLRVRRSKLEKSRLLPLHASTRRALKTYLAARAKLGSPSRALFLSGKGERLSYNTVNGMFQRLRTAAGLNDVVSPRKPRIHDLRHTFAVRSLEQCAHDRDAVMRHVVGLGAYLGHAHVTDTYWYLQATPTLMGRIARDSEALLAGGAA